VRDLGQYLPFPYRQVCSTRLGVARHEQPRHVRMQQHVSGVHRADGRRQGGRIDILVHVAGGPGPYGRQHRGRLGKTRDHQYPRRVAPLAQST